MNDDAGIEENGTEDEEKVSTGESMRETLSRVFDEVEEKESESKGTDSKDIESQEKIVNEPVLEKVPETPTIAPPISWSAQAKAKWPEIPQELQAELAKREEDVHRKFTEFDETRNFGKSMQEIISPYMPTINAEGGTPEVLIKDLINVAYQMRTGSPQDKGQVLLNIAKRFGADITQNSSAPAAYVDPYMQQLEQRQRAIETTLQQEQNYKQQQQQASINSIIEQFALKPENVHFSNPDVQATMTSLLQGGVSKTLEDAYEKAIYAHPEIRSTILAQQQAASEAKRLADTKNKTNAARNASASIKGGNGANLSKSRTPKTLREEIAAAYDDVLDK